VAAHPASSGPGWAVRVVGGLVRHRPAPADRTPDRPARRRRRGADRRPPGRPAAPVVPPAL